MKRASTIASVSLIALVGLSGAACSSSTSGPKCAVDVDCEVGICVEGRCVDCQSDADCAFGFVCQEMACVIQTTCAGDTCGAHGDCDDASGQVVCACEAGYAGERCETCASGFEDYGDGACRPSDPCGLDEPCSAQHRTCVNELGSAICGDCLSGYHQSGGGCIEDSVCRTEQCSGHGDCQEDLSCACDAGYTGARCATCDEGYLVWPAGSGTCVDDACAPSPCTMDQATGCEMTGPGAFACTCAADFYWNGQDCLAVPWVVFVSPDGDNGNEGTMDAPVRSIIYALDLADWSDPKKEVYVAGGTFTGPLRVRAGVNVIGGFDPLTWEQNEAFVTRIESDTQALIADDVALETTIGFLQLVGGDNLSWSGSAVAVVLRNAPGVLLTDCDIIAGNGGAAHDGEAGSPAVGDIPTAGGGANGCEDSTIFCSNCGRPGGGAGASYCGTQGGGGGRAGKPDASGAESGASGSGSDPASGCGLGGSGGSLHNAGAAGAAGCPGVHGQDGAAGDGIGGIVGSDWVPPDGGNGGLGAAGGAGGGGGGGGGGDSVCDSWGGGGGGGGAGGCGGTGGTGGQGGGASIGVLIVGEAAGVMNCTITTGQGGTGGAGGSGGAGLNGGGAGGGGGGEDDSGAGGSGGVGGAGGRGGHGGGGGGGPSVGIFSSSNLGDTVTGNVFQLGQGGVGGASAGQAGATGLVAETVPAQ